MDDSAVDNLLASAAGPETELRYDGAVKNGTSVENFVQFADELGCENATHVDGCYETSINYVSSSGKDKLSPNLYGKENPEISEHEKSTACELQRQSTSSNSMHNEASLLSLNEGEQDELAATSTKPPNEVRFAAQPVTGSETQETLASGGFPTSRTTVTSPSTAGKPSQSTSCQHTVDRRHETSTAYPSTTSASPHDAQSSSSRGSPAKPIERSTTITRRRTTVTHRHETSTSCQQRDRSERREMRATIRMAAIIGVFCAMWLGFFAVYVARGVSGAEIRLPHWLDASLFWLGYANSTVNPILYAVFNVDFRRAFQRIVADVCCRYCPGLRQGLTKHQRGRVR